MKRSFTSKKFVAKRSSAIVVALIFRYALEDEIAFQKEGVTLLEVKTASFEDCVSSLTCSLDVLRNRFTNTFKLANATEADRIIIGKGNAWAHGGDAVADALLYTGTGGRSNFRAFEKRYGMSPGDVIDNLNVHAKIAASNNKVSSDKFYTLFAEFVKLFKESGEGYGSGWM